MGTISKNLKLCKVILGRENWKERSNRYQAEKRQLQDKNRYLNQKLEKNTKTLKKAQDAFREKEKYLEKAISQEQKIQSLTKQLEETTLTLEEFKKKEFFDR